MIRLLYDGSFPAWLTVVFEVYERKLTEVDIVKEADYQQQLFEKVIKIDFVQEKAERVWKVLQQKLSAKSRASLIAAHLSEQPDVDTLMLGFVRYVLKKGSKAEKDYSHPTVLTLSQIHQQMHREKHRMEAFVRFQLTKDHLYYAFVEPDFNVLPLVSKHFKNRYADQRWLIYDRRRKYGIYYDLKTVNEVNIAFDNNAESNIYQEDIWNEDEDLYQQLWKLYFEHTNIPARKNMKLHLQHMPRRYWKYLTEKLPEVR